MVECGMETFEKCTYVLELPMELFHAAVTAATVFSSFELSYNSLSQMHSVLSRTVIDGSME